MAWIALGGLALLLVLYLLKLFAEARIETVKLVLACIAGGFGLVAVTGLLASGRGFQALWSLVLFGPAIWQGWRSWRAKRGFSAPGGESGKETRVETATLAMSLDHETGAMSGQVRRGTYAGRWLADLGLEALLDILAECAADDPESVPLLEAWLDRTHPDWREAAQQGRRRPADGKLTREEAFEVLGLQEGASEEEIRAAHRRLMRAVHPDQGGSAWLAARLNAARDLLLGK